MSKPKTKTFDCVQSMRQVRDKLSAEIADMNLTFRFTLRATAGGC
jgi:hypothetical protein